jgi:hypothetical protein
VKTGFLTANYQFLTMMPRIPEVSGARTFSQVNAEEPFHFKDYSLIVGNPISIYIENEYLPLYVKALVEKAHVIACEPMEADGSPARTPVQRIKRVASETIVLALTSIGLNEVIVHSYGTKNPLAIFYARTWQWIVEWEHNRIDVGIRLFGKSAEIPLFKLPQWKDLNDQAKARGTTVTHYALLGPLGGGYGGGNIVCGGRENTEFMSRISQVTLYSGIVHVLKSVDHTGFREGVTNSSVLRTKQLKIRQLYDSTAHLLERTPNAANTVRFELTISLSGDVSDWTAQDLASYPRFDRVFDTFFKKNATRIKAKFVPVSQYFSNAETMGAMVEECGIYNFAAGKKLNYRQMAQYYDVLGAFGLTYPRWSYLQNCENTWKNTGGKFDYKKKRKLIAENIPETKEFVAPEDANLPPPKEHWRKKAKRQSEHGEGVSLRAAEKRKLIEEVINKAIWRNGTTPGSKAVSQPRGGGTAMGGANEQATAIKVVDAWGKKWKKYVKHNR